MTTVYEARHADHGATHIIAKDLAAEIAAEPAPAQPLADPVRLPEPLRPTEPLRPIDPIWWRCLRLGPVSGRYEGAMTAPTAGAYELDLRVDIDPRSVNSPIMERVSGDIYRVYQFNWMGRVIRWRVYQRSWIVNNPTITWARCSVSVVGAVTFWKGGQPATTLSLSIPWGTFRPAGPATARLIAGTSVQEYGCARKSANFRDVTIEVDVAQSVNSGTILPVYNSHAHNDRPAGIQARDLDLAASYGEAGIGITLNHPSTVIDDSAPGFATWSPAELHDAMEGAFAQIGGGWPKWHMWGLMCGRYDSSGTAGIMFDAAAAYGGAGEAPERQGFAVFRNHSWFNNLPAGAPTNQAQAWALRQFLYTWVHEAGHAFNFVHSWNKGRANALSWMNYPQYVTNFWDDFEFRFDEEELIHLRHGDRAAVIMGGDAWATGLHLHGEAEAGVAEGEPPLELMVRSKGYFQFMEPVSVELRLRNLMADLAVPIDSRLDPRYGTVAISVMKPDGRIEAFEPVFCEIGDPVMRNLAPAKAATGAAEGTDRYSREVSIAFGRTGHIFSTPGEYRIRAVYSLNGLGEFPSPVHSLRVGLPLTREEDRLAQDAFSFDAGLCLALDGSRSEHLARGRTALETLAETCAKSMVGVRTAAALAAGLGRPFYTVDRPATKTEKVKLRKAAGAAVKDALKLTEAALKVVRAEKDDRALNIGYHLLVRQRAKLLAQDDKKAEALKEVKQMRGELAKRGVHPPVLARIDDLAKSLS